MQELGRSAAHPQQRLRVERAQGRGAARDRCFHRLVRTKRAECGHHGHRVAFVQRAARETDIIVGQGRHVRNPEVLVLQRVLDLVGEDDAQPVRSHRAGRGGRIPAHDELLGERIVEARHLLVEDVEQRLGGIDGCRRKVERQPARPLRGDHRRRQLLLRLLADGGGEQLVVEDLHLEILLAPQPAQLFDCGGGLADDRDQRVLVGRGGRAYRRRGSRGRRWRRSDSLRLRRRLPGAAGDPQCSRRKLRLHGRWRQPERACERAG